MCKGDMRCEAWVSLTVVGIEGEGCLRDTSWLNNIIVSTQHSISIPTTVS